MYAGNYPYHQYSGYYTQPLQYDPNAAAKFNAFMTKNYNPNYAFVNQKIEDKNQKSM